MHGHQELNFSVQYMYMYDYKYQKGMNKVQNLHLLYICMYKVAW